MLRKKRESRHKLLIPDSVATDLTGINRIIQEYHTQFRAADFITQMNGPGT